MQTLAAFPDESLLALVARSDDAAFALLYDRHSRTAYGLALRVLRNQALAADAVQDAFLDCWRTAGRFTGDYSVRAWIMLLVHRRAVDLVRREERRSRPTLEPITNQTGPPGEEEAILSLTAVRVRTALASLPDPERELLALAYYGGFSQSQLAERLQLPLGTVKSRMFAGLARLRELLADEEPAHRQRTLPPTCGCRKLEPGAAGAVLGCPALAATELVRERVRVGRVGCQN